MSCLVIDPGCYAIDCCSLLFRLDCRKLALPPLTRNVYFRGSNGAKESRGVYRDATTSRTIKLKFWKFFTAHASLPFMQSALACERCFLNRSMLLIYFINI